MLGVRGCSHASSSESMLGGRRDVHVTGPVAWSRKNTSRPHPSFLEHGSAFSPMGIFTVLQKNSRALRGRAARKVLGREERMREAYLSKENVVTLAVDAAVNTNSSVQYSRNACCLQASCPRC